MTELSLYKFIEENNIEYHWDDDNVIVFINIRDIEEWNNIIDDFLMEESGIECNMKSGYFCFWMQYICEYCDIEMNNVFTNKQ